MDNTNTQPNTNLWEEKNSTELKKNSLNETEKNQNDTMKETEKKSVKSECKDTSLSKNGIIYKLTNLVNNKIYIGITTKSLNERKRAHIQACSSKNRKYLIHKALNKYGIDNFKFEQIDTFTTTASGRKLEMEYIKKYNSFYIDGYGYNMTIGGEGTQGFRYNHSDETKQNISQKMKGKPKSEETKRNMTTAQAERKKWYIHIVSPEAAAKSAKSRTGMRGTPHTTESKQKLRLANLGKKHSEETRKKMSKSSIGRVKSQETRNKMRLANLGKKHSEETKRKLSISHFKHIPDDIYKVIIECIKNNLGPYQIQQKLLLENNFKISKNTIKKRFIKI